MKKPASIASLKKINVKSDTQSAVKNVADYVLLNAKKLDKETIAKYVGIALLVIYGIRKSNVVGSLILSIVTGLVTKFMSEKLALSVATEAELDTK